MSSQQIYDEAKTKISACIENLRAKLPNDPVLEALNTHLFTLDNVLNDAINTEQNRTASVIEQKKELDQGLIQAVLDLSAAEQSKQVKATKTDVIDFKAFLKKCMEIEIDTDDFKEWAQDYFDSHEEHKLSDLESLLMSSQQRSSRQQHAFKKAAYAMPEEVKIQFCLGKLIKNKKRKDNINARIKAKRLENKRIMKVLQEETKELTLKKGNIDLLAFDGEDSPRSGNNLEYSRDDNYD